MTAAISSSETTLFARGFRGGSGSFGIGVDCLTAGTSACGAAASGAGVVPVVGLADSPPDCAHAACIDNAAIAAARIADLSKRFIAFYCPPPGSLIHAQMAGSRQGLILGDGMGSLAEFRYACPLTGLSSALRRPHVSNHPAIELWSISPCRHCSSDKPISTSRS